MKILLKNVKLLPEYNFGTKEVFVATDGNVFSYIGEKEPQGSFDRVIDGKGNLLTPGFYNAHCHSAMTVFRGYSDDLPLMNWLNDKILPAEDKLTDESVYYGSMLAIAEMLGNGIVSFSDMYMFCPATAKAVIETGIKANISRSVVSFDENIDMTKDYRMAEALELYNNYNNAGNGRIKIDMSLHAEYSNKKKACRYVAEAAQKLGCGIQIHLSETQKEHNECIERNGQTPAEFFNETGVFDVPVSAAHCIYVTDSDIDILAEKGVTAVHNPTSNLKLGSGIMNLRKLLDKKINVALGTDGAASNNTIDLIKEMQIAAILHKGVNKAPDITSAPEMFDLISINGAKAQRRFDCGKIKVGNKADFVLIDIGAINNIPCYNMYSAMSYSVNSSNVKMTVVDGSILYENGEYTSIDKEKLIYESKRIISHYFD